MHSVKLQKTQILKTALHAYISLILHPIIWKSWQNSTWGEESHIKVLWNLLTSHLRLHQFLWARKTPEITDKDPEAADGDIQMEYSSD